MNEKTDPDCRTWRIAIFRMPGDRESYGVRCYSVVLTDDERVHTAEDELVGVYAVEAADEGFAVAKAYEQARREGKFEPPPRSVDEVRAGIRQLTEAFDAGREQGRRETLNATDVLDVARTLPTELLLDELRRRDAALGSTMKLVEQSLAHTREQGRREAAEAIAAMLDGHVATPPGLIVARAIRRGDWRTYLKDTP